VNASPQFFAAVAGDQQPRQTVAEALRLQGPESAKQCVDCSVAGDVHLARGAFLHEIGCIFLGGSEQQVREAIDGDAIAFLRPRHGEVVTAQPRFDMGEGNARSGGG
jgi:hypothetical protein